MTQAKSIQPLPVLSFGSTLQRSLGLLFFSFLLALGTAGLMQSTYVYSADWEQDIIHPGITLYILLSGSILSIVAYVAAMYKKQWSFQASIIYAASQGIVFGALSAYIHSLFAQIVALSILISTASCVSCWLLYHRYGIRMSERTMKVLRFFVLFTTLVYIITFILELFANIETPYIYENNGYGILFSLSVSILAILNTFVTLQEIDVCERNKAPEELSWFLAIELLSAIFWTYIELMILMFKWLMSRLAWVS